jgi:hypothetical protein
MQEWRNSAGTWQWNSDGGGSGAKTAVEKAREEEDGRYVAVKVRRPGVLGLRFRVLGSGFWVLGSGFWVLGSRCAARGFWVYI